MNKLRIVKVLIGVPLIVLFFVLFSVSMASASQWIKTYGEAGGDLAYSIQQTSDGGYIVAGYTASFGAGGGDAWVLKLDGNGNVQWQKTYGGTNHGYTYSIQQTSDGGYIVAGETASFGAGNGDAWVLKLDGNGNIYDCSVVKTSNAQVIDTSATVQDTNVAGIDTNVSPQTSTASVSNTNAVVSELCKCGCNLVPDATTIHREGTLGIQATATNYTNEVQVFKFATRITKPGGGKYPATGYLKGPFTVNLGPNGSISRHLSQYIPNTAPLGTYTYHGYVGVLGNIYNECQFTFTVTTQGQGCTLCHQ